MLGRRRFGGAHDLRLIAALAGPGGWTGSLDSVMAGRGPGLPGMPGRLAGRSVVILGL